MPGPSSLATTWTPRRPGSSSAARTTSPRCAYTTMLRATSEIAVATSVCSVTESPLAAASSRPFWRAVTMSPSCSIGTLVSPGIAPAPRGASIHEREALLEIQGRRHALERQPQLHHGEGDVGLDPHHHRTRAPQPGRLRDAADGAGGERIEDVEGRHVDDHRAGPDAPHPLGQLVPELDESPVVQRLLHGGDEDVALLHDGNGHRTTS